MCCLRSEPTMLAVPCRETADSSGSSPITSEEGPEGTDPANDAEGAVPWQQAATAHGRKGRKNKKKKAEGAFINDCFLKLPHKCTG